ncbi:unnamed protein product [Cylicocyclus nassatus]|uniref:Uncharacterized protein n=1 Tax=Cylicocyclus nassatus TaxID=53992 RepID=A0AA36HE84_CYLNA|nr:unnamed protein product [Cylicocyclus nassatus]
MPRTHQDLRRRYFHRIQIKGDCEKREEPQPVNKPLAPQEYGHDIIPIAPYFPRRRLSLSSTASKTRKKIWWSDNDSVHRTISPVTVERISLSPSSDSPNSIEKPVSKRRVAKIKKTAVKPADDFDHERWLEHSNKQKMEKRRKEEKRRRLEFERKQIEEENRRLIEERKRYEEQWRTIQERQRRPKKKTSVKVVRNSPYRKKQVKKNKTLPPRPKARSRTPTKKRIAPAQKVRRPKKKSKVIVKRPWAYVGDPTLRAYRTREQSYLSDFHF